jgi:hypothetical protein
MRVSTLEISWNGINRENRPQLILLDFRDFDIQKIQEIRTSQIAQTELSAMFEKAIRTRDLKEGKKYFPPKKNEGMRVLANKVNLIHKIDPKEKKKK